MIGEQPAILCRGLSKTYRSGESEVRAVQDLDLEVEPGQVFGFLGPNGAGKTTTIRLLLDLIRPTSGEAYLFGSPIGDPSGLKRVGALVEGADFYPFMTARENLAVLARTSDVHDANLIDRLLDNVDLLDRADQKVGDYSTGMKQRLGIAAVLLNDPELIILDEPTNGLDPAGIQEMRTFIRGLADNQNKTVFLSSHLLSEVEQVCDQVAIINHGRLVQRGSVDQLLGSGGHSLQLQVSPAARAEELLRDDWTCRLRPAQGSDKAWIDVHAKPHESPRLVELLVQHGVRVFQVIAKRRSLEEFFMSVTSDPEIPEG